MDLLFIVIVLALVATVVTMSLGLLVMSGGGDTDRWLSTRLMWVRLAFQGLTVLLLLLAIFLH
jgi:hypoxia induced protein